MSPNLTNEEKLDRVLRITEENNSILRSLRRTQYVSNVFRVLYWTVIIASLGGAYYFIKPLMSSLTGSSGNISEQISTFKAQLPDMKVLQEMLQGVEGSKSQ